MIDLRHGIAGGMAGIAVDVCFYPLDTIKTRIMASKPDQNLTKLAISKFRGFSCQLIVSFPYSFTFFYVYEQIRLLANDLLFKNIIASVGAQICANIVRNPFQVVKQQMMVGRNQHIFGSLKQIFRNKGINGFYIGYRATIMRDIVFSAVQLPLFQQFRLIIQNNYQCSSVLSASLGGCLAACISGFISCPFDVIKTRLMTQNIKNSPTNIFKQIYKENGINGFFKGVGFRCGILSFGGIIYFGALQKARMYLGISLQK